MKHVIRSFSMGAVLLATSLSFAGTGAEKAAPAAALGGYCPVAYKAAGKAIRGNPALAVDFAGRHYVFANAKAREMFQADPAKFQVAYDGYCATAASMGKKVAADPTLFTVAGGTIYLFSNAKAKKTFDADPAGVRARADAQWAKIEPAFGGYCPVAYVAAGKPVKGDPNLTMEVDGRLYAFANEMARKMFKADPSKYRVAYDGHCATAMSMGKTLPGDPALFTVADGTIYLFSSAKAKKMFDARPMEVAKTADGKWAALN